MVEYFRRIVFEKHLQSSFVQELKHVFIYFQ